MRVSVMMDVRTHLIHRNNAAVRNLALRIFKLNRGVVDAKFIAQRRVDFGQDAAAFRWRNVRDGYVAGHRIGL